MRPHQLSTPLELFGEDFAQPLPSSFCSKCELFLFVGIAVRILFPTHEHLHREILPHIKRRVQADQIDLAPEIHKLRGHDSVVAPDEPVSEILPHGGGQLPKVVWPDARASLLGMSTVSIFCMGRQPRPHPRCGGGRTHRRKVNVYIKREQELN